ncbi:MAG: hypothetical protein NZ699_13400 [Roseiflexus sp.]|nr:hypothetical protein [Roseiflexus sp.]MCS7290120.1 hypothetical protein [Roseiflexus sp.]MDW8148562.1 hypothetical protein [Roseiflexaceae bacterium]
MPRAWRLAPVSKWGSEEANEQACAVCPAPRAACLASLASRLAPVSEWEWEEANGSK